MKKSLYILIIVIINCAWSYAVAPKGGKLSNSENIKTIAEHDAIINDNLAIIGNFVLLAPNELTINSKLYDENSSLEHMSIAQSFIDKDLHTYMLIHVDADLLKEVPEQVIEMNSSRAKEITQTAIALVAFIVLYFLMWIGKIYL